MQELGKETRGNLFLLLRKVYEEKYEISIKNDGESVYFYDMHDGKMIYILTQHSPLQPYVPPRFFSENFREATQFVIQIAAPN